MCRGYPLLAVVILSPVMALADTPPKELPPGQAADGGAPTAPQWRYGELMSEVGHRFETMGRAVKAHRYELAAFELDELQEIFEEDLPHAERPKLPTEVTPSARKRASSPCCALARTSRASLAPAHSPWIGRN